MLARSFRTAAELQLSDKEYTGLTKALVLLETDQIKHVPFPLIDEAATPTEVNIDSVPNDFNMCYWHAKHDCGTIGCIGGLAAALTGDRVPYENPILHPLFTPHTTDMWDDITPAMAADVLRHFLETGKIDWSRIE